jgi:hypothetical protein
MGVVERGCQGATARLVQTDLVLIWFRVGSGLNLAWSGGLNASTLPLWGRVGFERKEGFRARVGRLFPCPSRPRAGNFKAFRGVSRGNPWKRSKAF